MLTGHGPLAVPGAVQPIALVLFVLVIGEEIGWRGYLLRMLLRRHSPAVATAIVAVAWAAWHSPLYFVPGMPSYGGPFLAFVAWVVPTSVLLTWLWLGTRSAWLTTVMHGVANLGAGLVFPMTDAATLFLFGGLGMMIVAAAVVIPSWSRFTAPPDESSPPAGGRRPSRARAGRPPHADRLARPRDIGYPVPRTMPVEACASRRAQGRGRWGACWR